MIPDRKPEAPAILSGWQPGKGVHVYVCKDRVKRGDPAITVARAAGGPGMVLARGSSIRLVGVWDVRQYSDPQPCGSTVVLETDEGEWRITDA
jgi:hypothetical protein